MIVVFMFRCLCLTVVLFVCVVAVCCVAHVFVCCCEVCLCCWCNGLFVFLQIVSVDCSTLFNPTLLYSRVLC